MGMPGPFEIGAILVIVVLIFGTSKLTGIGKSLGTAIHDFKGAIKPEEEPEDKPSDVENSE